MVKKKKKSGQIRLTNEKKSGKDSNKQFHK